MCFSASASFTLSAILAISGVALCIVKPKRFLLLSLIPVFFAIQQAAEGFVWTSKGASSFPKDVFLFFAYAFWPIWIPLSIWSIEKRASRKQMLAICLGIGLVVSMLLFFLIPQSQAFIYRNTIVYLNNLQLKRFDLILVSFYGISTILPLFLSSLKKMWILGIMIFLAGIITYYIDHLFFVSFWCFFAALFSLSLFFILNNKSEKN